MQQQHRNATFSAEQFYYHHLQRKHIPQSANGITQDDRQPKTNHQLENPLTPLSTIDINRNLATHRYGQPISNHDQAGPSGQGRRTHGKVTTATRPLTNLSEFVVHAHPGQTTPGLLRVPHASTKDARRSNATMHGSDYRTLPRQSEAASMLPVQELYNTQQNYIDNGRPASNHFPCILSNNTDQAGRSMKNYHEGPVPPGLHVDNVHRTPNNHEHTTKHPNNGPFMPSFTVNNRLNAPNGHYPQLPSQPQLPQLSQTDPKLYENHTFQSNQAARHFRPNYENDKTRPFQVVVPKAHARKVYENRQSVQSRFDPTSSIVINANKNRSAYAGGNLPAPVFVPETLPTVKNSVPIDINQPYFGQPVSWPVNSSRQVALQEQVSNNLLVGSDSRSGRSNTSDRTITLAIPLPFSDGIFGPTSYHSFLQEHQTCTPRVLHVRNDSITLSNPFADGPQGPAGHLPPPQPRPPLQKLLPEYYKNDSATVPAGPSDESFPARTPRANPLHAPSGSIHAITGLLFQYGLNRLRPGSEPVYLLPRDLFDDVARGNEGRRIREEPWWNDDA